MSAPFDDAFAGCLRGRSSDFHELLKRIGFFSYYFVEMEKSMLDSLYKN